MLPYYILYILFSIFLYVQVKVQHISGLHLLFPPTSNALQCKVRTNHKRLTSYKNTTSFFINLVFFFSSISQTSPRGRLESLDSGVEGMECSDRMDDLNRMDDLLPDLGLLTSHDCSLGTPGPNDPPAGQYSTRTSMKLGKVVNLLKLAKLLN